MALYAGDRGVQTGEWEGGLGGVIERCARPIGCSVALGTILRETGLHVVRIGSAQRKAIPVVLNGASTGTPSKYRMTALTLGAELALVQIGVAVYAVLSNLGKDFRYVARITRYILVQSLELKVCCGIVVKLKPWAKR